jgi:hypothetical protein
MVIAVFLINMFLCCGYTQCRVLKLADKPSCLGGGDQRINAG